MSFNPLMRISRPGWWLGGALAVSIAANVFAVGIVTGRLAFGRGDASFANARPGNGPAMASRFAAIPLDERQRFRTEMAAHARDIQPARAALRLARFHAYEALRAPVYDAGAMRAAFAEVEAATARAQKTMHAAVAASLATLSAPSRALLAPPPRPIGPP